MPMRTDAPLDRDSPAESRCHHGRQLASILARRVRRCPVSGHRRNQRVGRRTGGGARLGPARGPNSADLLVMAS